MPMHPLQQDSSEKKDTAPARERRPRASRGTLPTGLAASGIDPHEDPAAQVPATPSGQPALSAESQWRRTSTRIFGATTANQHRSSLLNPEEPETIVNPMKTSSSRQLSSQKKETPDKKEDDNPESHRRGNSASQHKRDQQPHRRS